MSLTKLEYQPPPHVFLPVSFSGEHSKTHLVQLQTKGTTLVLKEVFLGSGVGRHVFCVAIADTVPVSGGEQWLLTFSVTNFRNYQLPSLEFVGA